MTQQVIASLTGVAIGAALAGFALGVFVGVRMERNRRS
jgi:membrane associated rhomboid family serine protease